GLVNLGGGFGLDYAGGGGDFPVEDWAGRLASRGAARAVWWDREARALARGERARAVGRGRVGQTARRPPLRRARRGHERPAAAGPLPRAPPHRRGAPPPPPRPARHARRAGLRARPRL